MPLIKAITAVPLTISCHSELDEFLSWLPLAVMALIAVMSLLALMSSIFTVIPAKAGISANFALYFR